MGTNCKKHTGKFASIIKKMENKLEEAKRETKKNKKKKGDKDAD